MLTYSHRHRCEVLFLMSPRRSKYYHQAALESITHVCDLVGTLRAPSLPGHALVSAHRGCCFQGRKTAQNLRPLLCMHSTDLAIASGAL